MVNRKAVLVGLLCALAVAINGCVPDGEREIGMRTETAMVAEKRWQEQARVVAGRVLYEFFASSTEEPRPIVNGMTPERFEEILRIRGRRFSNTHGWGVSVEIDPVEAVIAVERQLVTSVLLRDSVPDRRTREEQPAGQMSGQPSFAVGFDEAKEIAQLFAFDHVGAEVIGGLTPSPGRLVDQAGIARYRFSWSNVPNDEQVRWGIRMIDVDVNPITGKVFYYKRREAAVDGGPEISAEQVRHIATAFFKSADLTARITMLTYLEVPMREGGSFPVWAITYEETIAMLQSIGSLFVDARTGDVVPDPGWLNDPGMAKPLQETRALIKEITSTMQSGTQ